jgi:hypothetical protein
MVRLSAAYRRSGFRLKNCRRWKRSRPSGERVGEGDCSGAAEHRGELSVDGDMFDALIAAVEIEGEAAKT